MAIDTTKALDVWLKFESSEDEEASHEANTFQNEDGSFRVEWYHTAVGQISVWKAPDYDEARKFLEENGFSDYTS